LEFCSLWEPREKREEMRFADLTGADNIVTDVERGRRNDDWGEGLEGKRV
jgi:hypothetical protein